MNFVSDFIELLSVFSCSSLNFFKTISFNFLSKMSRISICFVSVAGNVLSSFHGVMFTWFYVFPAVLHWDPHIGSIINSHFFQTLLTGFCRERSSLVSRCHSINVTKPSPFTQHTASQMLIRWGLQPRKHLFTKQRSEETGEQVSDSSPEGKGIGASRMVLGWGKGDWWQGKRAAIGALRKCVQVTVIHLHIQNRGAQPDLRVEFSGSLTSKVIHWTYTNPVLRSVALTSSSQFTLGRSWLHIPINQLDCVKRNRYVIKDIFFLSLRKKTSLVVQLLGLQSKCRARRFNPWSGN